MKKFKPIQLERPYKIFVELKDDYFSIVIADKVDVNDEGKVLEFRDGDDLVARIPKEEVINLSTHEI